MSDKDTRIELQNMNIKMNRIIEEVGSLRYQVKQLTKRLEKEAEK